jgi:hypothetical protein
VVHAYNPSYSRDRDQEHHSLKPVQTNSSQAPISKRTNTKKGWCKKKIEKEKEKKLVEWP